MNTTPSPRSSKLTLALTLVGLGLLANAAVSLFKGHAPDLVLDKSAFAQAAPGQLLGARGIYMMPAQLGPQAFGLYLMDVDSGTLCVYKANPDTSRFRLMAARSFKNDRFLEDYNNEGLLPSQVQKLITNQRQRQGLQAGNDTPTVDQSPKPDENKPDAPTPPPAPPQ